MVLWRWVVAAWQWWPTSRPKYPLVTIRHCWKAKFVESSIMLLFAWIYLKSVYILNIFNYLFLDKNYGSYKNQNEINLPLNSGVHDRTVRGVDGPWLEGPWGRRSMMGPTWVHFFVRSVLIEYTFWLFHH